MVIPRSQLRLTPAEIDAFLDEQRTLRLATTDDDGVPHVVPMWFVWHEHAVWLSSLRRSRRHAHLVSGRKVGLVVDDGSTYDELRGVRITGRPQVVADTDAASLQAHRRFSLKYSGVEDQPRKPSHVAVRVVPETIASWDFRKIPAKG